MRILFLGNNWVGWKVAEWLREEREEVVGVVLHPPERQKYAKEIRESSGLEASCFFEGRELRSKPVLETIQKLKPEIGVSAFFGYLLRPELLKILPKGCINIHPSLLPYNRGAYPNVWSIVEETPAGVTVQYLDEGVDTGDIIRQRRLEAGPSETGETLYRKLEIESVSLFKKTWPLIRAGKAPRARQAKDGGTVHKVQDVERIDEIDLERSYKAKEMINILRARTFPPYPGAYFKTGGKKVYLRLRLLDEETLEREQESETLH